MKSFASILAFASLGTATAAFTGASVAVGSEDAGESPDRLVAGVTVGTALVAGEKVVITADKAVFAAAGTTTCAFSNNAAAAAQTATGSVDATKKILTFTMTTALAAEATSITCTTNLGPNPAAGAVAFTIASFAADGTTVKDASIALGSYTTYAYPTGIVKQEWTDNTCTTEKADTSGVFTKSVGLVGVCEALGFMWRPTSATGGEYGSYVANDCTSGAYTPTKTFSYSTTTTKNCVTDAGKFYTYKTAFADKTATKVGVDYDLMDDVKCAAPQWQEAPLVNACTELKVAGITIGNFKFMPVAAGDLATGGMSAEKSVVFQTFAAGDTTCTALVVATTWGGVYSTGCADTSKTANNWKFCYDKACPAYSSGAISPAIGAATVAVAAAGALFLAA